MTYPIPDEVLVHHAAFLGKTRSGKTSSAKTAVERFVAAGERVCILDPIKSDWWGLTSSSDGQAPGLPFYILGGPHGHVPLPSTSGKIIGELVASGSLPLSIIDMADFEPGGLQRFFSDFANYLMRHQRGVLHLVIEEAHEFAPKERAGIGDENAAIHWAKKLATAGGSKGIRLIVATQRTQALHNAILGSCETLVAHRLTAPADQKPVIDWLKANVEKGVAAEIAGSLASLKTGTAWVCSGEAKLFQRVDFPRIATFDNSATPTGDAEAGAIKMAPVDVDALKALLGPTTAVEAVQKPVAVGARELEEAENRGYDRGIEEGIARGIPRGEKMALDRVDELLTGLLERVRAEAEEAKGTFSVKVVDFAAVSPQPKPTPGRPGDAFLMAEIRATPAKLVERPAVGSSDGLSSMAHRLMAAAGSGPRVPLTWDEIAVIAAVSPISGPFRKAKKDLLEGGLMKEVGASFVQIADPESEFWAPCVRSAELIEAWTAKLPSMASRVLRHLYKHKVPMTKEQVSFEMEVSPISGPYRGAWKALRDNHMVASDDGRLFQLAPVIREIMKQEPHG